MAQQSRFPDLTPEKMSPLQREVAAEIAAGPRGEVRGPFVALLHHPELARRLQQLGEQLRWGGKLPQEVRELAVLVTARRWSCEYEWVMHEKLARKAGVADPIIAAIAQGREPADMSDAQAAAHAFCRQALDNGGVDGPAFDAVKRLLGLEAALELLALCGYYTLMAMVLNTAVIKAP
jgi:4-carboxymuconolactone decarboxylase